MRTILLAGLAPVLAALAPAQSAADFATRVVSFTRGTGGGIFIPANALGAPRGGGPGRGSTHVLSLGRGGRLVLGFSVTLCDGPGADFIVCENPFLAGGTLGAFAELAFVEVSTDGVHFARMPNRYLGPAGGPGSYGTLPLGSTAGLAGAMPVHAPAGPGVLDPCRLGGDAFDLADLAGHALVRAGRVDPGRIHFLRIVDIQSGRERDTQGRLIHDPGDGCDIDAVAVVHHRGKLSAAAPAVALTASPGRFDLVLSDPQGLGDLDPATLRATLDGFPADPTAMLAAFTPLQVTPNRFVLVLAGLPPGLPFTLGFSLRDRAGHLSAARRTRL
jgi:hypothetical protein